ncbi:MAG: SPOR domain-containing protein [Melioribacteraceae bacterium]|nr:SPOR domain-containing protein [Melioribacteraceae bacterium]
MRKFYIVFVFILLLSGNAYGQKWLNVFEDERQVANIDTSSIKQYENQISLLSIIIYKTPQQISNINEEVKSVKSQLLFNSFMRKYNVIGVLYYNEKNKIVGESNLPSFSLNNENLSTPIENSPIMSAIYNKCVDILGGSLTKVKIFKEPESAVAKKDTTKKEIAKNDVAKGEGVGNDSAKNNFGKNNVPQVDVGKADARKVVDASNDDAGKGRDVSKTDTGDAGINADNVAILDPVIFSELSKDIVKTIEDRSSPEEILKKTVENNKEKFPEISIEKNADEAPKASNEKIDIKINNESQELPKTKLPDIKIGSVKKSNSTQYQSENETNPEGVVFTDGNLYCFQVSSWKNKATAESEADRLIATGHKAFVQEAFVSQRRGTWYRVRIGYFNSLQEAKDYQNNLN